jgi:hypothetical protein
MKITNRGCVDSEAGSHGFRAHKKGLTWQQAVCKWQAYRHHRNGSRRTSLWIKAALRAFREAGGYVPGKDIK